eukprot:TRINITY_DN8574_c0_g1_i2.p1 TRINITY_DN8574_c0_g1~~TRINITY_DN8574_c0_g1_i2.p1  ORF type:complete len:221 (+),score=39.38 TRINITY_DN8574_c0_g1_i2:58-720(+)
MCKSFLAGQLKSMAKRGLFIVFEGIDGSGKGTQLFGAAQYLFNLSKLNDVYITREPTRDFAILRESMAAGSDVHDKSEWYAEMFLKDRQNHIQKYVEPALANGTHVLCDRYKHSTFAYQSTQGMKMEKLIDMHEGILVPDLTIVLDLDATVAYERRKKDNPVDVFDKDQDFQKKLRNTYLDIHKILKDKGEHIVLVDADRSIEAISQEIQNYLKDLCSKT